jgi:hypothetical protein
MGIFMARSSASWRRLTRISAAWTRSTLATDPEHVGLHHGEHERRELWHVAAGGEVAHRLVATTSELHLLQRPVELVCQRAGGVPRHAGRAQRRSPSRPRHKW